LHGGILSWLVINIDMVVNKLVYILNFKFEQTIKESI
jgi:hypothetical protein